MKPKQPLPSEFPWELLDEARRSEFFVEFSSVEIILDQMIDMAIRIAMILAEGGNFNKERNPNPIGQSKVTNRGYDNPIPEFDFVGNKVIRLTRQRIIEQNIKDSESFYQLAEDLVKYRNEKIANFNTVAKLSGRIDKELIHEFLRNFYGIPKKIKTQSHYYYRRKTGSQKKRKAKRPK